MIAKGKAATIEAVVMLRKPPPPLNSKTHAAPTIKNPHTNFNINNFEFADRRSNV